MVPTSNWKSDLKAADRYDNIEKLRKAIDARSLDATGTSRKTAFAAETDAYNNSNSRDEYDAACETITEGVYSAPVTGYSAYNGPGICVGHYQNCHHLASGLVSEVYRSKSVALKVVTETRNVEPHNSSREVKILNQISHPSIIKLVESFQDSEGKLALVFPFMRFTLAQIINSGLIPEALVRSCFRDIFSALAYLHQNEIIHRDVKPSNVLLASPSGPAFLADFGTAWHPSLSLTDEPSDHKILEVGTTCYRAPETLFGNRSYSTSLDMWAAGTMLAECLCKPPKSLFESRDTSEDGNQLGLILSIFKTMGTPTKETWPEAVKLSTPPFEWYQEFPGHSWEELLPDVDELGRDLVKRLVYYDSRRRLTADQVLEHEYFAMKT